MEALETELRDQVELARAALRRARDEHDDYLADIHQAQLDALVRTADEHGLRLRPDADVIDLTVVEQDAAPQHAAAPDTGAPRAAATDTATGTPMRERPAS